jgi:hypothetical protein
VPSFSPNAPKYASPVPEQISQVKVLEKRPEQGRREKPARRGKKKISVRQCEHSRYMVFEKGEEQ